MSSLNPQQFHPNLNEYRSGGLGHREGDESRSVVGYVPTHILQSMHGNAVEPQGVEHYRQKLRSGEGFQDPAMVLFDPDSKRAYLGEGNHRVAAAAAEGISHVPTRVVRTRISDSEQSHVYQQGGRTKTVPVGRSPWANEHDDYWPSDIHPSHLFSDVR